MDSFSIPDGPSSPLRSGAPSTTISGFPVKGLGKLAQLTPAQAARLTPATLAHHLSDGAWVPKPHLTYIAAKIASAIHQGNRFLIINMPPRHGKSELLSHWSSVWALDRHPDWRIMLATYGAELATDFGRKVRDTIVYHSKAGRLNVSLRQDAQQVSRFLTPQGGGMFAMGVGGSMTGRGANLMFIDDYIKNNEEAESLTVRDKIYDWLVATAYTRLEPDGSIIILATRWHFDDLVGRLKRDFPDEWEVIEFPAIATGDDVLGRKAGDALWPDRYDIKRLEAIRKQLGTYWFEAEYQQSPVHQFAGMAAASWFPTVDILPHYSKLRAVRSWDFASTPGAGDYTVGTKLAIDGETGIEYILDVIRGQWGPAEVERRVKMAAQDDGVETRIFIEEEPGSSGKSLISHYVRNVLSGYAVRGVRATGQLFVRAQPFFATAEGGAVRRVIAPWGQAFIDEMIVFPEGPHDDIVASVSQAHNAIHERKYGKASWGRKQDGSVRGKAPSNIITGATFGRQA